jgi:hypothetical protein
MDAPVQADGAEVSATADGGAVHEPRPNQARSVPHTSGVVGVWLMYGTTSILSTGNSGSLGLDWTIQGIGDVNGDGEADVVWQQHTSGVVRVWFMNGPTILSDSILGSPGIDWDID